MAHIALANVVLDSTDVERAVRFWSEALGYVEYSRSEDYVALRHPTDPRRPRVGFQHATEPKTGVNPLHLDLETDDMGAEVARLVALGASRVPDWPYPDPDANWVVLRDPDGHEFCVTERPNLVYG